MRRQDRLRAYPGNASWRRAVSDGLFVGLDVGTSGVRAVAVDASGAERARSSAPMPEPDRDGARVSQDPEVWWAAVDRVLAGLAARVPTGAVSAIAVDGTSGTLLLADAQGSPLAPALMYNDGRAAAEAARIGRVAPADSGGHGASSALAKLLYLQSTFPRARYALHQADWIVGRLTGRYGVSDENNALKLGYDVACRRWPDWFDALAVRRDLLPEVRIPGEEVGVLSTNVAQRFGLPAGTRVVAGSTDGVAAFMATGARNIGDGVTSLGSTLVVKVLSNVPLFEPRFGVYSHRLGDLWLPGGASNAGGAALLRFFTAERMAALATRIDPTSPTGLHYYPLPSAGERFPVSDPDLQPLVEPRPDDDVVFFQGLLEGLADIECRAYRLLESLGAPYPRSVRSVGGGARNQQWTRIRARTLGVEMVAPLSAEAAYGMALLAMGGAAFE